MSRSFELNSTSEDQTCSGDEARSAEQSAQVSNSNLRFSVLIVSEVRLLAEGLALALANGTSLAVCGCSGGLDDAVAKIPLLLPDVVMLNATLRVGAEVIDRIRILAPQVRVVALAISEEPENVIAWAEAGAAGYIPGTAAVNEVVPLLANIMHGKQASSETVVSGLLKRVGEMARLIPHASDMSEHATPTKRELQILEMLGAGFSNKEIARKLNIGVATTKSHVHNVLGKLRLKTRGQAATWIQNCQPRVRAAFGPSSAGE
jgi:two-component system nitrate/nitrite response regulator NarL